MFKRFIGWLSFKLWGCELVNSEGLALMTSELVTAKAEVDRLTEGVEDLNEMNASLHRLVASERSNYTAEIEGLRRQLTLQSEAAGKPKTRRGRKSKA